MLGVFAQILEHEDIDLLERMARALGSAGLYGHKNPSILPFYATAKRYSGLAKDIRRRKKRGGYHKKPSLKEFIRAKGEQRHKLGFIWHKPQSCN